MGDTYTYHHGRRLSLVAKEDAFVSRAGRRDLLRNGFPIVRRLSQHSYQIATSGSDLPAAISRAQELGPAFRDYAVPDGDTDAASEYRISDRIFVRFRTPQTPSMMEAFHDRYGTRNVRRYSDTDFLLQVAPLADPVSVVRTLHETDSDRVVLAEHDVNHAVVPQQIEIPTDDNYQRLWHLHDVSDPRFVKAASTHCQDSWVELDSFGSPDIVIAVTDGAFDGHHPDFDQDKLAGWAYIDENNELISSTDPRADISRLAKGTAKLIDHGTACAGLAAARANKKFAVGVAPGCRLYLMKFPNEDGVSIITDSTLIDVVMHLRDRVDIVTSSWGKIDPRACWSTWTQEAIAHAALSGGRRDRKGIVFVWAAGNNDRPLSRKFDSSVAIPYERIGATGRFKVAKHFSDDLVDLPNVLHVAASTSRAQRAHYSNYGDGVALAAPSHNESFFGCSIGSAEGIPITTSGFDGTKSFVDSMFGGTSAAAPIVAGVAALTISANPDLTAAETISILRQTAERALNFTGYPKATHDCPIDRPELDVSPVLPFEDGAFSNHGPDGSRSPWFGYGRVDAFAAVRRALATTPVIAGVSTPNEEV
jgi:subtilisin family serine protease